MVSRPYNQSNDEPRWETGESNDNIFSRALVAEHEWGNETTYGVLAGEFCGKVMTLKAGASIPSRVHRFKHELLSVLEGQIRFLYRRPDGDSQSALLQVGDCVYVFPGLEHGIEALADSVLVESSSTEFWDMTLVADPKAVADG